MMRSFILAVVLLGVMLTACGPSEESPQAAAPVQQQATATPAPEEEPSTAITDTMMMTDTASMTDTAPMTDTMMITATSAMAELKDVDGNVVGTATFTETVEGVTISVTVSGLISATTGEHGIHIHQVGTCSPDFAAAGGHYNPTVMKHGFDNPAGPHAGDLENIVFEEGGNANYSTTSDAFTISGATSLLAADGSSIVIHADADDYRTDPSGKSGGRIACGVLMAAGVEPMPMAGEPPPPPGGSLNSPSVRTATPADIASLQVPTGFTVTVFAKGLDTVRMMAQAADGSIYVTRRGQGDVIRLMDEDGDGMAEPFTVVTEGLAGVHGILIQGDQIYLADPKHIYAAALQADGAIGELQTLVDDLPDGAQHGSRTIAFGPDGLLYVSIGSPCNACGITNPEHAALLQLQPDGSERTVFANGLRNTLGWGWHPETGELWGMDHGSDWRGNDQPPEELNRIEQGNNYGWPYCYADQQVDQYIASPPPGVTKAEFCAMSTAPGLIYQAHSAPIGMVFYTGDQFPEQYRNDAFVAMRGSWNREEPTGYKVVHLNFEEGQPTEFSDFLTGFLLEDERAVFGRPAGLLVMQDGSLLVSDDTGGTIYQIRYEGE